MKKGGRRRGMRRGQGRVGAFVGACVHACAAGTQLRCHSGQQHLGGAGRGRQQPLTKIRESRQLRARLDLSVHRQLEGAAPGWLAVGSLMKQAGPLMTFLPGTE